MDSNNQIVSCGRDSTSIVFHNGDLEGDTYQFDVEGASSVCDIACYRQDGAYMIAVATDDHNVLSYSYCSGNTNNDLFAESKFNTVLLRFTATINTLDVNVNDTLLAAGSSDFTVKMVDLTDPVKVSTIEGHDGPILCVKFDPLNIYLASSSCDGTIKLWSIENKVRNNFALIGHSNK
jgi:chromosome transmission fidelity protein 4